jgi:hypothetical protein
MEPLLDNIAPHFDVPFGIVKRWATAMLLIVLTCACENTPVHLESRALADPPTQSSERFLIVALDNDPIAFLAHAGSTPRGYGLLAPMTRHREPAMSCTL